MKKFKVLIFIILLCSIISIPIKANETEFDKGEKVILIDPGHGGFDGGAKSKSGIIEKDINLSIGLKLRENLEKKGYKVCMTRDSDVSLNTNGTSIKEKKREDLKKRCDMKTESQCDIFISIHQNTFPQSKYYGAQIWYASNDNSSKLAKGIQTSLRETVDDDNKRESKDAGEAYAILRDNYDGACVLIECGFLSNQSESEKLSTEKHQLDLVSGISLGIDRYFQQG